MEYNIGQALNEMVSQNRATVYKSAPQKYSAIEVQKLFKILNATKDVGEILPQNYDRFEPCSESMELKNQPIVIREFTNINREN